MIKVNGGYVSRLFRLRLLNAHTNETMDVFCSRWGAFDKGITCEYSNKTTERFLSKDWTLTEIQEF